MTCNWKSVFSILMAAAIALAVFPVEALAAKPRSSVSIKSSLVKLSDLFLGLEAGQDCDIGPAPAPGRRITIGQLQLAAIAAQFGVDWQSGIIPAQVVIERLARSVTREELLPLVRSALEAAGAPENSDISLGTYATLEIPAEIANPPDIEQLSYDSSSGRFTAQLLFDAPGVEPMRLLLAGTAQEMIDIPVLAHNMSAGTVVGISDLQVKRVRKGLSNQRTLLVADDAIGLAVRHQMAAGTPVSLDELSRPVLVSRGMSVILRLDDTGLILMAKGEAIDDGALGDRIHVLNPASRAVLIGRVTGSAAVQVDPTSAPVMLVSQQSGLPPAYSLAAIIQPSRQLGSVQ